MNAVSLGICVERVSAASATRDVAVQTLCSRRVGKLLQRVRLRGGGKAAAAARRLGDWARLRLRPVLDRFFAAALSGRADEAALHRFRIEGKELRYAMELLAVAFLESFRT